MARFNFLLQFLSSSLQPERLLDIGPKSSTSSYPSLIFSISELITLSLTTSSGVILSPFSSRICLAAKSFLICSDILPISSFLLCLRAIILRLCSSDILPISSFLLCLRAIILRLCSSDILPISSFLLCLRAIILRLSSSDMLLSNPSYLPSLNFI